MEGIRLEVMRDLGTRIIVCSIENFDPMGVHTGDSIRWPRATSPPRIPAHARRVDQSIREIGVRPGFEH